MVFSDPRVLVKRFFAFLLKIELLTKNFTVH